MRSACAAPDLARSLAPQPRLAARAHARSPSSRSPSRARASRRSARTSCVGLVGIALESIADPAQRFDVHARFAELLAQALDVRVDGARGDVGIDAPHVREQRVARLYAAAP